MFINIYIYTIYYKYALFENYYFMKSYSMNLHKREFLNEKLSY